jgi:hypothetical protein
LFVERGVLGVAILLEAAECFARGPVIEREIASGTVQVAEEFGALIVGTGAEELGPGTSGAVDFLEGWRGFRLNVEFLEGSETHSPQF